MRETLIHYTDKPLLAVRSVEQDGHGGKRFDKPQGLWVSVKGEDDWAHWCAAESFGIGSLAYRITLTENAKILRLYSAEQIDSFTMRYLFTPPGWPLALASDAGFNIDWPAVARGFQGIVISPYIWERRLASGCSWYYGWDCASGCIWDATAIASIRQLGRNGKVRTQETTTGREP